MKLPAANGNQRPLEIVEQAEVGAFLGRSDYGKSSETWKVTLIGYEQPAWLKLCVDNYQLVSEVLCAQVGRCLGFHMPKPYLVRVDLEELPKESQFYQKVGESWFFASQNACSNPTTLERIFKNSDELELFQRHVENFASIMVFDEWIANTDRNDGNLLLDPCNEYKVWLIDHGDAFFGSEGRLWGQLKPKQATTNLLASQEFIQRIGNNKIERVSNCLMDDCMNIFWETLGDTELPAPSSNNCLRNDMAIFLQKRIEFTPSLIADRLGIPRLSF